MADLDHLVGSGLKISPTGGLQLASGPLQGQEKIIRRLLTNAGDLLSNLDYGASIPKMIGSPGREDIIKSIIQNQMKLEKIVQQNPPPKIGLYSDPDTGLYFATIQYVDNSTLERGQIKLPLGKLGN